MNEVSDEVSESVELYFSSQEDFDAYCVIVGYLQYEVFLTKEFIFPCAVELTYNKISGMVLIS